MGNLFSLEVSGNWDKTFKFLKKAAKLDFKAALEQIGQNGVTALKNATPKDSGLAANSWSYVINDQSIEWHNYDVEGGYNVAILVEYGHGLHQGGYIAGRDFINPAIRPVIDSAIEELWREVNDL